MTKNFQATIEKLTFKGLGLCHGPSEKVFFVPETWPGDECLLEITKEKKTFGHAKVIKLINPSPERRSPPCLYQDRCGGCPWMIGSYASQIEAKKQVFQDLLKRYKLSSPKIEVIASPQEFSYKSRAQFHVSHGLVGFYQKKSHQLVDLPECLVLSEKMNTHLQTLRSKIKKDQSFTISLDEHAPDDFPLTYRAAFSQGHSLQNDFMKKWLKQHLSKLETHLKMTELFSGSGNFTKIIKEQGFKEVLLADSYEKGVAETQREYPGYDCHHLNLYKLEAEQEFIRKFHQTEILILDPPRTGLKSMVSLVGGAKNLQQIFYISCNPDSLLLDCKELVAMGFNLVETTIVDAFPQTPHMEVLAALKKGTDSF